MPSNLRRKRTLIPTFSRGTGRRGKRVFRESLISRPDSGGAADMAKARAIVKRRKAVRNIRKITKTMQMIATAKFQKSLKRAVGTKPYTLKVRELVRELA